MTFTLALLASSASGVDWSRPLMIAWIVIALGLSLIEIWLAVGFSSRRLSAVTKLTSNSLKRSFFLVAIVMAVSLVMGASTRIQAGALTTNMNTLSGQHKVAVTDPAAEPAFKDYKGVRIGMSADEVAEKLGESAVKEENEEVFLISDFEMAQVLYDKAGRVSTISITYSAEHRNPPTALTVLGEDVAADANGRIYKLIRFPELGYWVAYSRNAGEAPIVSVTINKL